ncbi:MAG: hypothetical protein F6K28_47735 [Microcoleus sp. SIO2G3]|nr:hypothetical protein [Microcoleus sp. SIO2G3]
MLTPQELQHFKICEVPRLSAEYWIGFITSGKEIPMYCAVVVGEKIWLYRTDETKYLLIKDPCGQ